MTRCGKLRSRQQKQHTEEIQKRALVLKSSSMVKISKPIDPRAASKQRKKDIKEVKAQQCATRSAHKREERLKEKIDKQAKVITSLR